VKSKYNSIVGQRYDIKEIELKQKSPRRRVTNDFSRMLFSPINSSRKYSILNNPNLQSSKVQRRSILYNNESSNTLSNIMNKKSETSLNNITNKPSESSITRFSTKENTKRRYLGNKEEIPEKKVVEDKVESITNNQVINLFNNIKKRNENNEVKYKLITLRLIHL